MYRAVVCALFLVLAATPAASAQVAVVAGAGSHFAVSVDTRSGAELGSASMPSPRGLAVEPTGNTAWTRGADADLAAWGDLRPAGGAGVVAIGGRGTGF